MARDAYAIHAKDVVIFWSRKAGNTSLAEWLAEGLGARVDQKTFKMPSRRLLKRSGDLTIDFWEALDLIEKENFEDFVLARNPYRRVVSAYVEKFIYYGHRPMDSFGRLKGFSKRAFLEAMLMQGKPAHAQAYSDHFSGLTFRQFLQYIAVKVHDRDKHREPDLNHHWNTQVPLHFDGRFDYTNIIKLEHVREEVEPLAQKLECALPFPHSRSNSVAAKVENNTDLSDTPSVEMIKVGIVPGAKALLNSKTTALIREAYEIDFRKLGYDPNDSGIESS